MKELKEVPFNENGVRRLKLLKDAPGRDNVWNYPKNLVIPAGTILTCAEKESGERGDLFFQIEGTSDRVMVYPPAFTTRYPYDLGTFNPEYLAEV